MLLLREQADLPLPWPGSLETTSRLVAVRPPLRLLTSAYVQRRTDLRSRGTDMSVTGQLRGSSHANEYVHKRQPSVLNFSGERRWSYADLCNHHVQAVTIARPYSLILCSALPREAKPRGRVQESREVLLAGRRHPSSMRRSSRSRIESAVLGAAEAEEGGFGNLLRHRVHGDVQRQLGLAAVLFLVGSPIDVRWATRQFLVYPIGLTASGSTAYNVVYCYGSPHRTGSTGRLHHEETTHSWVVCERCVVGWQLVRAFGYC